MTRTLNSTAILLLALTVAACSRPETPPATDTATADETAPSPSAPEPATSEPATPATPAKPDTDTTPDNPQLSSWLGEWIGPEGTYLKLQPADQFYSVEIANLDGAKTYKGTASGDTITFERNGKTETIRATDGDGTGMKWLAGKTNCLVVTKGSEGFCRD